MGSRGRYGKYGETKRFTRLRKAGPIRVHTRFRDKTPSPQYTPDTHRPEHRGAVHIKPAQKNDAEFIQNLSKRVFNQYGPYQHLEKVIPRFITSTILNEQLTIHGDGSAKRDWTYVEDTCEAIDRTLHADINKVKGEVINIEVWITGRKSDGTDRALYHLEGLFYRNTAGNVTQEGSTSSITEIESNAAWDCSLVADTTNQTIDVRVTGIAGTTINWKAIVKYTIRT